MKRFEYYRGVRGKQYGIWNIREKKFQFHIKEDTPMLAEARLYQKIGDDARKWRFEVRQLPVEKKQGMVSLDELVFLYFQGDYEKMIRFLGELYSLTGISTEPLVRELDKITHERY